MSTYRVTKHPKGWEFRKHGAARALRKFADKEQAVLRAKEFLKGKGHKLVVS